MEQPFIIEILIIPSDTFPNAYRVRRLNPETFEPIEKLGDLGLLQVQLTACPLLNDVKTIDMLTNELTRNVAAVVRDNIKKPELQGVQILMDMDGKPTSYDEDKPMIPLMEVLYD